MCQRKHRKRFKHKHRFFYSIASYLTRWLQKKTKFSKKLKFFTKILANLSFILRRKRNSCSWRMVTILRRGVECHVFNRLAGVLRLWKFGNRKNWSNLRCRIFYKWIFDKMFVRKRCIHKQSYMTILVRNLSLKY